MGLNQFSPLRLSFSTDGVRQSNQGYVIWCLGEYDPAMSSSIHRILRNRHIETLGQLEGMTLSELFKGSSANFATRQRFLKRLSIAGLKLKR